ncbi:MAG: MoaD/ThiS family protein [Rhodanobacter sp.]|jgi:molybdopterin converting factor subunit 1|nr:MoaD/ThiS family protein [Rhodanobacter sp.]
MTAITVEYFAQLREQAGQGRETLVTGAASLAALYAELQQRHGFRLEPAQLKVAVNAQFRDWAQPLAEGDVVVFIPPVAGG